MKVFVTKYALSRGIEEAEVEKTRMSGMVRRATGPYGEYFHSNAWHHDRASAMARAEDMRLAKIASLEKQIAKLKAMRFE